jgi:solute:Na+ symporter, SSS family
MAFAGYVKLFMPVIVVMPGICAFVLAPELSKPDQAYPEMMKLLPHGLLGITFAALVAAIASSLSSMANSVSTIFTMDIYKQLIRPNASDKSLVFVGRASGVLAMVVAVILAEPFVGKSEQAFQFIQQFTGFFTPGIVVIFLFGFFWKKATSHSALAAGVSSVMFSAIGYFFFAQVPFLDRMALIFVLCVIVAALVTFIEGAKDQPKAIDLNDVDFSTSKGFNASALGIICILVTVYTLWW